MSRKHTHQVTSGGATRRPPGKRRLPLGGFVLAVAAAGLAVALAGCGPVSAAGKANQLNTGDVSHSASPDHATQQPETSHHSSTTSAASPSRTYVSQLPSGTPEGSSPDDRDAAPAMTESSTPTPSMPASSPSPSASWTPSTAPTPPQPTAPATIMGTHF